jgi:hypothetical protein
MDSGAAGAFLNKALFPACMFHCSNSCFIFAKKCYQVLFNVPLYRISSSNGMNELEREKTLSDRRQVFRDNSRIINAFAAILFLTLPVRRDFLRVRQIMFASKAVSPEAWFANIRDSERCGTTLAYWVR